MDLYQKNPNTLRRLLAKRQNPCTQVFKAQPLNSTKIPVTSMDLDRNDITSTQEEKIFHFLPQDQNQPIIPPNPNNTCQTKPTQQTTLTQSLFVNSPSHMQDDDNDDTLNEKIQKKVKINLLLNADHLKSERKFSCEEKDQSEHSTACDTRSEQNVHHEQADFLFSPPMVPCNSKDISEMKLDDNEENPIKSGLINLDLGSYQDNSRKNSEDFTQQLLESLDPSKFLPGSKPKAKCKLNHQTGVDIGGCSRCEDLLRECKEFARQNQGTCLNEEYEEAIRYRCIKGHCWSLNYKNSRRRWCSQCTKDERAFLKKKCQEEKIEREKQEEEFQRKLFEEARKKALSENEKPSFSFSGVKSESENQKPVNTLEYLQKVDCEIESLAKKYSIEFMSQKGFTGELTYQQILQVYKIKIMPEEVLRIYMFNLNADTLRSEFRRIAKVIHPDKNKHPEAGNAFQKIHKVYEVALSRLEGNQQKI